MKRFLALLAVILLVGCAQPHVQTQFEGQSGGSSPAQEASGPTSSADESSSKGTDARTQPESALGDPGDI